MKTNLIITDDFYTNPDAVRAFALSQEFSVKGNYPGARTLPFLTEDTKEAIQHIVRGAGGNVTNWLPESGYTGAFQICTEVDRTWIHADYYNMWAAVCYLTPNAPLDAGTALFKHKASGQFARVDKDYNGNAYDEWVMTDVVANRYNRIVMYRGELFHASLNYFGKDLATGRLFQTFFFNTEY